MESPYSYIAADRLFALARGVQLPARSTGAALFADVSGFTPLAEVLLHALGADRGAEELSHWLNKIYDVLIDVVDGYRGSVISFSGDAITCWFDDQDLAGEETTRPLARASLRATACALAMQDVMRQFAQVEIQGAGQIGLAIKVTVSSGPVRRFVVGDPSILLVDAMAGDTLDRMAVGEHQAAKGEVLIDEATAAALKGEVTILEERVDQAHDLCFMRVGVLTAGINAIPWPELPPGALSDDQIRPWLLSPVYERLKSGRGEFLTELRSTVALFLHFGGIDFDNDLLAQPRLDTFIQTVERILTTYGGYLLQLMIGDKGCHLYASFGAPIAYEDNALRAVSAAMELRELRTECITGIQIGVGQGLARTGAYGGPTRRTYGALGDDVNLAARLMQHAPVGEVLVAHGARKATLDTFTWEDLPPIQVKGKAQHVRTWRLLAKPERRSIHLHEPKYALPMVGRQAELALIGQKLNLVLQGHGQIVGITAEAGMGKSRLAAEVIRMARARKVISYGGECQSYGTHSSYLVWRNIWRGFFGLDASLSTEDQARALELELAQLDTALVPRLPLLGAVLNLPIPDNDLTASFDAKLRKDSLESLLADCVRHRARGIPLLMVLEDCHWLDALSSELLEAIGRAITDLPVLILLAYRPVQVERLLAMPVSQLLHFTEITLQDLPPNEIEELVCHKLMQTYGTECELPAALIKQITARTEGNPFYIEELLNYLHDRGINPEQPEALEQIELPSGLQSLILSRIDQLTQNQQTVLKVASVIGRLFRTAMLWGVYNQFGSEDLVRRELEVLSAMDLTALYAPEPELAYLFKHVLTRDVAYETLSFATRAFLHNQIGQYIEENYSADLGRYLDLLAYHYDHTENTDKKREYLLRAGDAARIAFANAAAISYYRRVLPLQPDHHKVPVMLSLGQVLERTGEWQSAEDIDREAQALADCSADARGCAQARQALGWLLRKRGEYGEAESWLAQASDSFERIGDMAGVSRALADIGEIKRLQGKFPEAQGYYDRSLRLASEIADPRTSKAARAHALRGTGIVAAFWNGDHATARKCFEESLELKRELGDTPTVATLLNNLAGIARFQRQLTEARERYEESLDLFRKMGDRWAIGQVLNNQACVAGDLGDYTQARLLLEECLTVSRQLGDRTGLALALNTLADVLLDEGDFAAVRPHLHESLIINRSLGDQTAIAYLMEDYAGLAAAEGKAEQALRLAGFAAALRESIGAPLRADEQARVDRMLTPARDAVDAVRGKEAWEAGRCTPLEQAVELALASS